MRAVVLPPPPLAAAVLLMLLLLLLLCMPNPMLQLLNCRIFEQRRVSGVIVSNCFPNPPIEVVCLHAWLALRPVLPYGLDT